MSVMSDRTMTVPFCIIRTLALLGHWKCIRTAGVRPWCPRPVAARGPRRSVACGRKPDALAGDGPAAAEMEDRLPRHDALDRLLQLPGGERCEDRLGVNAELGSESAANERG